MRVTTEWQPLADLAERTGHYVGARRSETDSLRRAARRLEAENLIELHLTWRERLIRADRLPLGHHWWDYETYRHVLLVRRAK